MGASQGPHLATMESRQNRYGCRYRGKFGRQSSNNGTSSSGGQGLWTQCMGKGSWDSSRYRYRPKSNDPDAVQRDPNFFLVSTRFKIVVITWLFRWIKLWNQRATTGGRRHLDC